MKDFTSSLGICIPVYNNLKYLKKNLAALYQTFEKNDMEPLKIFISDNASDDGLNEAITDLKAEYPSIVYNRNQTNEGYAANFEKALKMADTDYAWLLGVDDSIQGDIGYIIDVLKEENPDFLCLINPSKAYENIESGMHSDRRENFMQLAYLSTWISRNIFKTAILPDIDFAKYADSWYIHVYGLLDYNETHQLKYYVLRNRKTVYQLNPGYISWSKNILTAHFDWVDVIMSFGNYTYQERMDVLRLGGRQAGIMSNMFLLSLRMQGYYDRHVLKKYYEYIHSYNPAGGGLLFLISVFPRNILQLAHALVNKLKDHSNDGFLNDC